MSPADAQPEQCGPEVRRPATGAWRRHAGQFLRYLSVGGVSTLTDWGVFYLCALRFGLHYQTAVVISLSGSTVVHYTCNKLFTFRCRSRRILRQLLLHVGVSAIYLLGSMLCMYLLVGLGGLQVMSAKIVTTAVMMVASFTLHKRITFNPDLLA